MKPVNFLEDNKRKDNNIKKILNENKIIVYMIPLLLILIFIVVDYIKLKNNTDIISDNSNNFSDSKLKEVNTNIEQEQPSTVFVYDENDESSINSNTGAFDKTDMFFNELEKVEKNDKIVQDIFNLLDEYKGSDKIKVNEFYFDDYNRIVIIGDASKPEFINELISKLSNTYRIDFILEDMRPSEYGSYFKIVGELNGTI